MKRRWRSGIICSKVALSRPPCSAPAYDTGITTSTPYGFPPTCSSIQRSSTSSCSGEGNASAPRTPRPPARLTAVTTSRQWLKAKIGNSMPKVSQMRVRTRAPLPSLGGEADGHVLDAADEVGAEPGRRAGELDVGQAAEQLLEHDPDLQAREVGAEAEVGADPEAEVVVRMPSDVEAVGMGEVLLVAVRGAVPERHPLVFADGLAVDLRVVHRGAHEVHDRGDPAHHLVHRGREERRVAQESRPLLGMLDERQHPARDRVARRLVARHEKQEEEGVEVDLGALLALDLGLEEHA